MDATLKKLPADIAPNDLKVFGDDLDRIREMSNDYADVGSLTLPLLWMAQRKQGYVTAEAMEDVAALTGKTMTEVQEVVTFYTMYFQKPVGKYVLAVCHTLPCALNGAEGMIDYISEKLGIQKGETTPDGKFTLFAYECLGCCSEAPMMLVNETTHIRLNREKLDALLDSLD